MNTYYGGVGWGVAGGTGSLGIGVRAEQKNNQGVPILQTTPIDKSDIVNCFAPFIHELKILRVEIYKRLTQVFNLCN